jgi:hypothetical protein
VAQVVVVGEEDTSSMKEEAAVKTPWRLELAGPQAPQHLLCVGRPCRRLTDIIEEGEGRARADTHNALGSDLRGVLGVSVRECVGHRVKPSWSILHCEVEPEQLVDPLVLRHGRLALVQ